MAVPIVFDLDGTLIHSVPDIHKAVNLALDEAALPSLDLATVTAFVGNGLPKLAERVMAARGMESDDFEAFYAMLAAHYDAVNGDLTRPYPGVIDALHALAVAGHPLGICTNKPGLPAQDILRQLDLAQFFDVVIGGDHLAVKKPDPAPLFAAFEAFGESGLYVGDSEVDADTAQAAQVPFLLYTQGYRKTAAEALVAVARFDEWSDMPALVETRDDGERPVSRSV